MREKGVSLGIGLKGTVPNNKWVELSPIVHSLVGKIGELGLADELDVSFEITRHKRRPSIRSSVELGVPEGIYFQHKPVDDLELAESIKQAGVKVRERRLELGLSQTSVTAMMGDEGSHGWLSNLERNNITGKRPLAAKVYLLAQALELDPASLLDDYGYEMTVQDSQT